MTAAGLVIETGSPMAHGPTVAREYGIPAVICVRDATQLITSGQLITIDGAAGTVVVATSAEDPDPQFTPSLSGPDYVAGTDATMAEPRDLAEVRWARQARARPAHPRPARALPGR